MNILNPMVMEMDQYKGDFYEVKPQIDWKYVVNVSLK